MSCEPSSSKHTHPLHFHHRRQISYDDGDVSMLLDPAYTRPRSSSSQTRVYKDHRGDLHDPDYRHFPFPSTPSSPSTSSRRSKRVTSGPSSIVRPGWELSMDEEEFEAYYNDGEEPARTQPWYPSYSSYSPSSSASSSPSSFTTTLSDTDVSYYPASTTTTSSCKLTKRLLSRNTHTCFVEEHVHPSEVEFEEQEDRISLPDREKSASPTGSTSEAMKKQWQATKFSVQFGVFRAQRRVKEALALKR